MASPHATVDRVFQALAHPTRRAVVERLAEGPAAVTDLAEWWLEQRRALWERRLDQLDGYLLDLEEERR